MIVWALFKREKYNTYSSISLVKLTTSKRIKDMWLESARNHMFQKCHLNHICTKGVKTK